MVDVCKDADVTDLRRSLLKGFGVFQERHFSVSAQLGTPVRTVPGSVVGGALFCWPAIFAGTRENGEEVKL
jgi:hypothetical protein